MADCCRSVIRTPRRIVFLGGSLSLFTPAILAAVTEDSHDSISTPSAEEL